MPKRPGRSRWPDWIGAHIRAFEFLGGLPEIVVPDNLKSGVNKPCRYEPELNRTYQEMAAHYGVAVVPARARKPRDKAKVESGVLLVERWIMAALRKRRFLCLGEVNQAIRSCSPAEWRPFRKLRGRAQPFEAVDKPDSALCRRNVTSRAVGDPRVNIDYHVAYDHHWYSVPYQLTGQQVEVRATAGNGEIFHRGVRVASHARSPMPNRATTARTSAQGTPAAPRVDSLPVGRVGPDNRPGDRRTVRPDHRLQAPPGKAIDPASVFCDSPSSSRSSEWRLPRVAHSAAGLLLSEHQVDTGAPS